MINKEELVEFAQLAKISLSTEEAEAMYADISNIMDIVESINDVDLSEYDCSDEAVISELREDVIKPSLPVELVLSNAAEKQDNFFIV